MPSTTTNFEVYSEDFGERLRASRRDQGLSLQELAARADVSASFLSQIENGKSRPSVETLFAIASSLGIPVDDLFGSPALPARVTGAHAPPSARPWATSEYSNRVSVIHPTHRAKLAPIDGVLWERLAATPDRGVNFKRIVYEPGAASAANEELVSHTGHEYGFGIAGAVEVTVGALVTVLGPGESIDFASTIPHRLRNLGDVDFVGLWVDHYPFH